MIKDREIKIDQIVHKIKAGIDKINTEYRRGPSLYFYKRVRGLREDCTDITKFLAEDFHLEMLYATLVAWDMNSRGAKMVYFDDFKRNILSCLQHFKQFEYLENLHSSDTCRLQTCLLDIYNNLKVMESKSRLVSNSKLMHFLFPKSCMPIDRENTLYYLYKNKSASKGKYNEIVQFVYDVVKRPVNWDYYLDNDWNYTVPKLIDNAIILLNDTSTKKSETEYELQDED